MRMRRYLHRPLIAALAACALALAAGCGGDDDGGDDNPQSLLAKAAAKPIPSADVSLRTEADVPGFPILGSRIVTSADGPFVARGPGGKPAFDWRAVLRAGGETFPARIDGSRGNVYVEFMGRFYEADDALMRQLGLDEAKAGPEGASLQQLGLDPDSWLTNVRVSDGEEVGGDETRLVTGRVDKRAVIEDLLGILDREEVESAADDVEGLPELDDETIDKAADAVDSARVEVNVDEDDYPRRVHAELRFTMPEDVKDTAIESGTVVFDLELNEIGEVEVAVEPPFDPDPLSSLLKFAGTVFGVDEPSDLWRRP